MVFFSRSQKGQSLFGFAKNLAGACQVATAALLVSGCAGNGKKTEKASPQQIKLNKPATTSVVTYGDMLTSVGENESPSWSADNLRLLFVSKNRDAHKNSQVYELEISSGKERRISYSDGDVSTPIFVGKGSKLAYASTTDEIKERPLLLKKNELSAPEVNDPPSEIYLSDISGVEITRLTQHPGFDGSLTLSPTRENEIFYSSRISDKAAHLQILKMNISSKTSTPVFEKNDKVLRRDFSTLNNRMAWIQTDLSTPENPPRLFLSSGSVKNAKPVENLVGNLQDLQWFEGTKPGEEKLLMTRRLKDQSLSQTVIYDPQKNCLKVLLAGDKFDISQARLSSDRRRVAFVSDQVSGKHQILSKWVQESELECEAKP